MKEIIALIERDFPFLTWLLRSNKTKVKGYRYFAQIYDPLGGANYQAYANKPSEALSMVYNSAMQDRHSNPRKSL